jgi:hypothetical protein
LSLDFVNGFNSMFRHIMLGRLYALPELSALWRIADLCHSISLIVMAWLKASSHSAGPGRDVCLAHCCSASVFSQFLRRRQLGFMI